MIFNVILNIIIEIMNDKIVPVLAIALVIILFFVVFPFEVLLMIIGVSVSMSQIMAYCFSKYGVLVGNHYDEDRPIWVTEY